MSSLRPSTLVFLPGLDGTGHLAEPLQAIATQRLDVIAYEPDAPTAYQDLVPWVMTRLPSTPYVLIAESFSAPVALRIAAQRPPGLRGVVLSNGVSHVLGRRLFRLLPWRLLLRLPKPCWAVRLLFTGRDASQEVCDLAKVAIDSPSAARLAERMGAVLRCDMRRESLPVRVPILCLHGTRDRLVYLGLRRVRAPDGSAQRIAGPHMLLQAQPESCWTAIQAMLERVDSMTRA